jgi:hypothetical protein
MDGRGQRGCIRRDGAWMGAGPYRAESKGSTAIVLDSGASGLVELERRVLWYCRVDAWENGMDGAARQT